MNIVDKILAAVDAVLNIAGTAIPGAQLADALVKIIQKGVSAYEAHTGQPIDPSLIKPMDPLS